MAGADVATPNKRAGSGPMPRYALLASAWFFGVDGRISAALVAAFELVARHAVLFY